MISYYPNILIVYSNFLVLNFTKKNHIQENKYSIISLLHITRLFSVGKIKIHYLNIFYNKLLNIFVSIPTLESNINIFDQY